MKTVAVIGLGNIATRHRRNLKRLFPHCRLLAMSASGRVPKEAVSDSDEIVSSIAELVDAQVEFALVASPAPFHAQHAIPLLEAGIPTLIEKPVTSSAEDALRLEAVAKETQTPVAVGYCLRYLPSAMKMRELLQNQSIGTLYNVYVEIGQYLPDWRPSKDYRDTVSANAKLGGGALLELSHELDYSQWLLGPLNVQFSQLRSSHELGLEVEDIADIVATTEGGAIVNIHLDFLQKNAYRKCRFVGSKGTLEWDLIGNQVTQVSPLGQQILYSEPDWDKNQMYLHMLEAFFVSLDTHGYSQRRDDGQSTCETPRGDSSCLASLSEASNTIKLIAQIKG